MGPINVRDWRIICLCMERIVGSGVKETKARWAEHAKEVRHDDDD
jgi:hypothetical protein